MTRLLAANQTSLLPKSGSVVKTIIKRGLAGLIEILNLVRLE
jgi:hypothetical protein